MKFKLLLLPLLALTLAAGDAFAAPAAKKKPAKAKTTITAPKPAAKTAAAAHKPASTAHKTTAARNNLTQPMPAVVSPPIPKKIEFAGETIDFDRQDMYERLDRELSAFI